MSVKTTLIDRASRGLAAVLLLAAMFVTGCKTNPATGESQFNVLSTSEEIAIGEKNAPEFLKSNGGPIPSQQIQQYVSDLGMRLAEVSERPDLPWEFFVLDSKVINAFALPGGKVFMSRGLLEKMTNEAQLAGVLGHEVGHVTAQHIGQQMSQAIGVQAVLIGVGVAASQSDNDWAATLGVGAASAGGSLYLLKFGRDQETESDTLGVRYMARLGYNPMGQVQVMRILREASGGGSGGMEILSTHPLPQTRIERLRQHIKENYPGFRNEELYTFEKERFKTMVIDELATLPPAKHPAKQPDNQAQ